MSSLKFDRWREGRWPGVTDGSHPSVAYRIQSWIRLPAVNMRTCKLWRPDNRYPGTMMVRRHESDGVELSFDAIRHGARPRPPIVVAPESVDTLILSLLEVRAGVWGEMTGRDAGAGADIGDPL